MTAIGVAQERPQTFSGDSPGESSFEGFAASVRTMAGVDVVVVSYNSRETLRECVTPLVEDPELQVIIVDNASADAGLDAVRDLPVTAIQLDANGGFAAGCNIGWRSSSAGYILFLNPDAQMVAADVHRLVEGLERRPSAGLAAPRIVDSDGGLEYSQRRFPRLRSTYAQALFLHRLFPHAGWTDELIRDPRAYSSSHPVDWVSGACVLVRREVLEELGGWDDGFFMYGEDIDLCRRVWDAGYEVLFEHSPRVIHQGGASAPRAALLPTLAASRIRYAGKHRGHAYDVLERAGIALGAFTHLLAGRGGREARAGHVRALRLATKRAVST
jgi:N-acetylglucosaminyl-diphospho-decaprenol L-rhamnosyltransferase